MAQWNSTLEEIVEQLDSEISASGQLYGLAHALIKSWQHEDGCLVWLTQVPGNNIFGSLVVFVNEKVLNKLQWSFEEWESGTAPQGVFRSEEAKNIKLHLDAKSPLPLLARMRKKTTPQNQEGDPYILYFHHDLPHNLRLTVGIPA